MRCNLCLSQIVFNLKLHKISLHLLLLFLLFLLIHGKKNHQFPEDCDKIKEQVHAVPDIVLVSIFCFLNDELSVKQDKSAHDDQPEVHVCLEQHDRAKEHIHHRHQEQQGEARHQSASQEEVAPALGIEGTESEANEDDGRSQERCHNDAWVDSNNKVHGRAQANTCEESKASEDGQSLFLCLVVVWRHGQPEHHPQRTQQRKNPPLKETSDNMHVGAGCSHEHAHRQTGVDILQVHLGRMRDLGELEESVKVYVAVEHVHVGTWALRSVQIYF